MSFPPFSSLQTERLHLRQLQLSDWEMICYLRSDPAVNQFVVRPSAETREEATQFIRSIQEKVGGGTIFYWAISWEAHSPMMGSICLWNFSTDYQTAELGYDLSPAHQGKGIMQESLKAVLTFGIDVLGLHRIEAYTQHQNERSVRLLERNGFVLQADRKDPGNIHNRIYARQV